MTQIRSSAVSALRASSPASSKEMVLPEVRAVHSVTAIWSMPSARRMDTSDTSSCTASGKLKSPSQMPAKMCPSLSTISGWSPAASSSAA